MVDSICPHVTYKNMPRNKSPFAPAKTVNGLVVVT